MIWVFASHTSFEKYNLSWEDNLQVEMKKGFLGCDIDYQCIVNYQTLIHRKASEMYNIHSI